MSLQVGLTAEVEEGLGGDAQRQVTLTPTPVDISQLLHLPCSVIFGCHDGASVIGVTDGWRMQQQSQSQFAGALHFS